VVASRRAAEVWSVPSMDFVSCIRLEVLDMMFSRIGFNYEGDKYLTFCSGEFSMIQVWTTSDGVCDGSFEVPRARSAYFLANNDILYLGQIFDGRINTIEAVTLNVTTGLCDCSAVATVATGDKLYEVMEWDYSEIDDAFIIVYKTVNRTGIVGRWNLRNKAWEWQVERQLILRGACNDVVVSCDGSRVAVCSGRLEEIMVGILCTVSGDCVGMFPLVNCWSYPHIRFLPHDREAVAALWSRAAGFDSNLQTKLFSIHNFIVNERLWEREVDNKANAVPRPVFTVLL
jgi:hypothetical protein